MAYKTDAFSKSILNLYKSQRSVKEKAPLRNKIALINALNFDRVDQSLLLSFVADQGEHFLDYDSAYCEETINREWHRRSRQIRRESGKQAKKEKDGFFDMKEEGISFSSVERLLADLVLIKAGNLRISLRQWLFCKEHIGYSEYFQDEVQLHELYLRQKRQGDEKVEYGYISPNAPMCEDVAQLEVCVHSLYQSPENAEYWMLHLPSVRESIRNIWNEYTTSQEKVSDKKRIKVNDYVDKILKDDYSIALLINRISRMMTECELRTDYERQREMAEGSGVVAIYTSYESRLQALKEAESHFNESKSRITKERSSILRRINQESAQRELTNEQINCISDAVLNFFDVQKAQTREDIFLKNLINITLGKEEEYIPLILLKCMDSYGRNFYRNDCTGEGFPQQKVKRRGISAPELRMKQIRFIEKLCDSSSFTKTDGNVYHKYLALYGYQIQSAEEYRFWRSKLDDGIDLPIVAFQVAFQESMQICLSTRDGISLVGTSLAEANGDRWQLYVCKKFRKEFWSFVNQHYPQMEVAEETTDSGNGVVFVVYVNNELWGKMWSFIRQHPKEIDVWAEPTNSADAGYLALQVSENRLNCFWAFVQQHYAQIEELAEIIDSDDALVRTYIQWWKDPREKLINILKKELKQHNAKWDAREFFGQSFLSLIWNQWINTGGELSEKLKVLQQEFEYSCNKEIGKGDEVDESDICQNPSGQGNICWHPETDYKCKYKVREIRGKKDLEKSEESLWLRKCQETIVEYIIREKERKRAMQKLVVAFDHKYGCSLSLFAQDEVISDQTLSTLK